MANIKSLVGKKMSKKYKFMDEDIQIQKLSTSAVLLIQAESQKVQENDTLKSLEVMRLVIRSGVTGGDELEDSDFESWPLDEVGKLAAAVMEFSGLQAGPTGDKGNAS